MTKISDPRRQFWNDFDTIEKLKITIIDNISRNTSDKDLVLFTLLSLARDLSQDEYSKHTFIDKAVEWIIMLQMIRNHVIF